MLVNDLMATDLKTCGARDSLLEAAELMWDHDIGAVVVVDEHQVIGMLTDRDIAMAAFLSNLPLAQLSVGDSMSDQVVSVRLSDTVETAEQKMAEHAVRRLPVLDENDALVGFLSLHDLALAAKTRASRTALSMAEVAKTLQAVSTPRLQA